MVSSNNEDTIFNIEKLDGTNLERISVQCFGPKEASKTNQVQREEALHHVTRGLGRYGRNDKVHYHVVPL